MSPELIGILTVGVALAALILNGQRTINERLARLENGYRTINERLARLESDMTNLRERMARLESDVANMRERMARLEGSFAMFTGQQSPSPPAMTPAPIESP